MTLSTKSEIKQPLNIHFEAIGTVWDIEIFQPLMAVNLLEAEVIKRIELFDKNYSRFRDDSLVTKISHNIGTYQLPDDAEPLFDLYRDLYQQTNGLMTPLVGNLLSDAGYDATYTLKTKKLRRVLTWDESLDYHFPQLTVKQPVLLDFGAAGKGYLVDIISNLILSFGIQSFCINAGGDIYTHGTTKPLEIALQHPDDQTLAVGIAYIKNIALCGSSPSLRAWGEFHHIINPSTQSSPRHIKAVWAVAQTALLADALTTALFFIPANKITNYKFDYAIIHNDDQLECSSEFPGEFFIDKVKL